MLNAGVLTIREFVMREPLPLADIHKAVFEFLRRRTDAALFGAQAVNAYVGEPRMTQDVDVLSTRAAELAEELRNHLASKFHIAVRVRQVAEGKGFRIYQAQKTGSRHLVDLRSVEAMPAVRVFDDIQVLAPAEMLAAKVIAYHARRNNPKSGTDWRDIAMLLLTFPELKSETGAVADRLRDVGADESVLKVWRELVNQDIESEESGEDSF